MVLNYVAAFDDFSREFGMCAHVFAHAKECRLRVVFVQLIEHPRRDGRVWPIVERERDFIGGGKRIRQARDIRPQQTAAWPQADSC